MANDRDEFDKTSVLPSETLKVRLTKAGEAPPSLVLLVGPGDLIGRQWLLSDPNMVLGRGQNSQIFIDDGSISRSHAKFVVDEKKVSVVDLESTNRTVVNGKVIPPLVPILLGDNDKIKTGNVIFKYLEKGNIETLSSEETYQRAMTDPLTGIFNKGALIARGTELFKKAKSMQYSLSVIVFDLDHFKKVNDTYGHQAGDYVLKELSSAVQAKLIRQDDVFARFGGEEFVLLLFGSTLKQASEIAERIRATIENHNFVYDGTKLDITVSCGVASMSAEMTSWDDLFKKADEASYKSKKGGRNRVSTAA